MKKEIKSKFNLKLNKHTISNLSMKEMNSIKGGTQLDSVQGETGKCQNTTSPPPPPPPPPTINCNTLNREPNTRITRKVI